MNILHILKVFIPFHLDMLKTMLKRLKTFLKALILIENFMLNVFNIFFMINLFKINLYHK